MRLTLGVMRQEEGGRRYLSGGVSLFALIVAALLAVVLFSWISLVQARDGANQLRATPLMEGKHMSIFIPSQSPTATSAATPTPTPTPSPTSAATPTPTSAPAATPGATATTATGSSGTNSSNNLLIWLLVGLLVLIILSLLANAARQRSYRRPPPDIP